MVEPLIQREQLSSKLIYMSTANSRAVLDSPCQPILINITFSFSCSSSTTRRRNQNTHEKQSFLLIFPTNLDYITSSSFFSCLSSTGRLNQNIQNNSFDGPFSNSMEIKMIKSSHYKFLSIFGQDCIRLVLYPQFSQSQITRLYVLN